LPLIVNRDYSIPAFIGPDSLVIASSYSGNTEETLITSADALKAGAKIVAVTTGGELAQWAEQNRLPLVSFSYKAQPRAALGYSFSLVLGILARLGWVSDKSQDMDEAIAVMKAWQTEICETVPAAKNKAKQIAQWLWGCLPVVYGAGYLSEIARRWKGQFNENAKSWGFFEQMPELDHNAVMGYVSPSALRDRMRVILLRSSLDHPRNQRKFEVTEDILKRQGVSTQLVEARGQSALAQMLSVVHLGDYVSYYLAMLYQNDPTPVDTITYLKEQMAK
jgi:glucose/mannose-6-phosphate isomerase